MSPSSAAADNDLLISEEKIQKDVENLPEYNPDEATKKRVSSIKSKFDDGRLAKTAYERTWFINGCFVVGHHFVTWNDIQKQFDVPVRMSPFKVRLVTNIVLAYFRRTKSRLTASKPGAWIRPASTDEKDVERSRNQEKVLESEMERLGHQERLKEGVGWMLEASCWFYHLKWNPYAGPPLFDTQPAIDPATGQPQVDPQTGQPAMQQVPITDEFGRQVHRGENELEIVSPFEIVLDRRAKSIETAEWIIRTAVRSITWIRENYPKFGKFVKGKKEYLNSLYEQRLRSVVGTSGESTEMGHGDCLDDSAVVYEYWEKPTLKYPDGRWVITAGDVELFSGPNPYAHKQFPFVLVGEIMIPGRFWPLTVIEQLIPLQRNYNRGRSQEVENRTLHGRPKILTPTVCKVRKDSFDAEPGEKIDYISGPRGEKPELMAPQSTAQATQNEVAQTLSDMQEVGAWHEASRGVMPSANSPGIAIERLQTADDTSLGETAQNIDIGIVKLSKQILNNCHQFWDEERMVRAGGEAARTLAMKIRGEDLAGDDPTADYFDVQVMPQSTILKDKDKQRADVKDMIDMGALDPVVHQEKILKMLDVGKIEEIFADDHLDEQRAQQENELMERGQMQEPRDFENHKIHLQILDRFRKTERYRRLPKGIQQLFDMHAMLHVQLATQVMMQSAQATAAAHGPMAGPNGPAGGPNGGPPPPPSQGSGQ